MKNLNTALRSEELSSQEASLLVVDGVGLHTGVQSRVVVDAAPAEYFQFTSNQSGQKLDSPARLSRLSGTARSTALVLRGENHLRAELRTVEHFLAALYLHGFPLWTVHVERTGHPEQHLLEMPILDGSAKEWMDYFSPLKVNQPKRRRAWKVLRSFEMEHHGARVLLTPLEEECLTVIRCEVDFGHGWQQEKEFSLDWSALDHSRESFYKEIAPARTFGFTWELESLRKRGLAQGGSLDNALLLSEDSVINDQGFIVENELASHKVLDAFGDFALLGAPLLGKVDAHKAGHSMHLRVAREALAHGALVEVELDQEGCSHRLD